MSPLKQVLTGHFDHLGLRRYLAALTVFFGGSILLCWWLFPAHNAFSIHTHTFSYLGSFEEDRNPHGWWLFVLAMTGWGLASMPLVAYTYQRLHPVAPRGARASASLLLMGSVGITLVGLFPDAQGTLIGAIRWTDMHYVGAVVLVLGFVFGIPTTAVLLFRAARDPRLGKGARRAFRRACWPHVFFIAITSVGLFFLTRWLFVYEERRAAAEALGLEYGSPWRTAMNTPYSFPLWDNVFVYTLFVYFLWTALTLPGAVPVRHEAELRPLPDRRRVRFYA